VLWNGNREPLSNFYSIVPNDNVILWAWMKYPEFVQRYLDAMADPRWRGINFVRLRSRAAARRWLESIDTSSAG
jgi:hypothetical protein